MPTSIIEAIQERYAGLTSWSGKPADLWFGDVWPTRSGAFVSFPFIRFKNTDSPLETTFAHQVGERWQFAFEVFSETVQQAKLIFDNVMYNQAAPSAGTGFWKPTSVTVPTGYAFKHLILTSGFAVEPQSGQFAPSAVPLVRLSWSMELWVQRTE